MNCELTKYLRVLDELDNFREYVVEEWMVLEQSHYSLKHRPQVIISINIISHNYNAWRLSSILGSRRKSASIRAT